MNVLYLAYEIHIQNFVWLWGVVVEICWNSVQILLFHFWVCFYQISLILFYERVLFSLRNPCSNFCAAVVSRCGDMLKFSANTTSSFLGAFFIRFLWFLFMNMFSLSYEIGIQNSVQLWRVVAEICWNWVEILLFHFRVFFLSDFFDFKFIWWTCSYLADEICQNPQLNLWKPLPANAGMRPAMWWNVLSTYCAAVFYIYI